MAILPVTSRPVPPTSTTERTEGAAPPPAPLPASADRFVGGPAAQPRPAAPAAPRSIALRAAATPNAAIQDLTTTTSTVEFTDDVNVDQLSLNLDLGHSFRGDLRVTVVSPSGKAAVVHNRQGGSADDLTGSFDLSAFKGEQAKGTWTLKVEDLAKADTGTLKSWSLSGVGSSAPPPKPTHNDFQLKLAGPNPPKAAGGFFEQLKQASKSAGLASDAKKSIETNGREPSNFAVESKLRSLNVMTPTSDASSISHADYFSRLQGVPPEKAYDFMVKNPQALFGGSQLKMRPPAFELKDGARLMLEDAGPPAKMWFPVEVRLDPIAKQIRITTLDGHPLRGTNVFKFNSDGAGGTRFEQLTRFQLSSKAVELGMSDAALDRQHGCWRQFHQTMFDQLIKEA
ncbi:MAG: proprotein convertase P-domain-containing protein [Myxococcota bacterium]|nr:proprotein convertase P-domain-containing protein [Myxococcota bacterium]